MMPQSLDFLKKKTNLIFGPDLAIFCLPKKYCMIFEIFDYRLAPSSSSYIRVNAMAYLNLHLQGM